MPCRVLPESGFVLALALLLLLLRPAAGGEPPVAALLPRAKALENVAFGDVVASATGFRVIPVNPASDRPWINKIGSAMDSVLASLNDPSHPIHSSGRINEASRHIEEGLTALLAREPGWQCGPPPTASGKPQRAGYPDIRLVLEDGSVVYLDPKLHAQDSRSSSFRTFYYEPKTATNKINDDARHLVVGVAHAPKPDGSTTFTAWELIDIAAMPVRLKLEFQSSNRDIYRDEAVVASGSRPAGRP
jgi:hypothetical protein